MAKIKSERVFQKDELDMRGVNPDPDDFYDIGRNIVTKLKKRGVDVPQIVTGGDFRPNTPELIEVLEKGITGQGGVTLSLGYDIAKPLAYIAGELFQTNAVTFITASHVTVRGGYNGIKINLLDQKPAIPIPHGERVDKRDEILRFYQDYLKKFFGSDMGKDKKVVIDPLYGTAYDLAPKVFEDLGFVVAGLHDRLDRSLARLYDNAPDPHRIENLEQLMNLTREWGDIGAAFDGDMDRIAVIGDDGEEISANEIIMIIAEYLISKAKGKPKIVYEIKSSNAVPEVIQRAGGVPVMQKTGWQNIKEKMREIKSIFGGEVSGHIFYGPGRYSVPYCDDGLFTALMISKISIESGKPLSQYRNQFPVYFTSPELRVDYKEDRNPEIVKESVRAFDTEEYILNVIDGDIRIEKQGNEWAWLVVRTSKTQPEKLTLCFEGRTFDSMNKIFETFLDKIPGQDRELRGIVETTYNNKVGDPNIFYRRAFKKV